jgi:predicted nucleotidyltransferase component of viral defense system
MIDKEVLLNTDYYKQPYQKEKDYIQELFLGGIYTKFNDLLVFKGGTALSKFYNSPRFSDDLDFSVSKKGRNEDLEKKLDGLIKSQTTYPTKTLRKLLKRGKIAYELSIRGPLFESLNKYQHLKIEIDQNATVFEQIKTFRRDPKYQDLIPYVAIVMDEREILAEKVVALMFRHNLKARDLYDLYFLVRNGTEIKISLIDKKMREYGHIFTEDKFIGRLTAMQNIWKKELDRLLPESTKVDYVEARDFIIRKFKEVQLL